MDSVVHFEFPADDSKRSADFYSKAFGWGTIHMSGEYGEYVMVHTGPTDEKGMPQKPAFINGGIYKRTKAGEGPSVVIAVEDLQASMQKVKDAGGKILGGSQGGETPDDIPGIGLYVAIEDTEGNRVGMLQPKGM
jgi:uncharacterized protein